jgi:hypothetical protein
MAYFNKKKDHLKQTVFSNVHESNPNPVKTYYAFLEIGGKNHYAEYVGKFRVEALADFQEQARLHNGKFNGKIYALKN